jgi:iron complex outermembrane receptor protein
MSNRQSVSAGIVSIAALTLLTANSVYAVDEIIVKTRKTDENVQDVPIAITTVSEQVLQRAGADGLEDITKYSPSFIFDQNSTQKDVRIAVRGLSATRGRSNVAFLVDGIDVTTEAIGTAGAGLLTSQRLLSDVQQVEAVKGPQSALYGRAAFAGAINYVTKDAPDEFAASIGGEFAEYEDYSINGSVGAPITDTLGWLANGYWFDEEGQYHNAISGSPLGGGDGFGGSLTFNWAPTSTLDFKARFEYIDEEYDDLARARNISDTLVVASNPGTAINGGGDFVGAYPRTFGDVSRLESQNRAYLDNLIAVGADGIPGSGDERPELDSASINPPLPLRRGVNPRSYCIPTGMTNPANGQPTFDCDLTNTPSDYEGTTQELFRFSLVANWDVDAIKGTLSSLTGYVDSETHEEYDWDGNAVGRPDTLMGTLDLVNDDTVEIFSQEIRYRSDFDGQLNFTLGAQYWTQERVQMEQGMLGSFAFGPASGGSDLWQEDFFPFIESGQNIRDPRKVEDDHKSIYALLEWDINDRLKVSLENRYTKETFTQNRIVNLFAFNTLSVGNQDCFLIGANAINCTTQEFIEATNLCGPPGSMPAFSTCAFETPNASRLIRDVDSEFNTPKVTLEWKPNDNSLYYFSVGKAVKPAGMDVLGGGGPPVSSDFGIDLTTVAGYNEAKAQVLDRYIGEVIFDSEKMWAYELGAKNTFTGGFGDLVLNSALFFQDYTDKQVSVRQFDPVTSTTARKTVNAGAAEVWGLEVETSWFTPIDGLSVNAAWTWLPKTEYTDFDEVTTSQNTAAKLDNCVPVDRTGDPDGAPTHCLVSRAGRDLERAPEHAVVMGANYTQPLAGTSLEWFIEGNAIYQSERFSDPENTTFFEEYTRVDLRLGIESDQWEALIFVDNAFDDDTITSGSEIPDTSQALNGPAPRFITLGILPDQRQVGVRMKYNF